LGRRFTVDDSPVNRFTLGLFADGGSGSYDTGLSSAALGEIQFSGDSRYVGGGFLTRAEFHNGAFMEISFRTGQAKTEIDASPAAPAVLSWSNPYFGAVGGAGYLLDLNETTNLNLYARMLWSHQKSQVVDAIFKFDELNSTRTHLGGRLDFEAAEGLKIYAGAAWEHEFNGRQDFKLEEVRAINPPDFGGDSLLSEAGLTFSPFPDSGFSAQLGLGASLGARQGLTGGLRLNYEFF
jgi:outer membrane autotransporter protein